MILAWILACLPNPDDPVAEPAGWGPPPPPIRTESRAVAGNSVTVALDPVGLADYARGAAATGVEVVGDRIRIPVARWEKGGREADVFWLVFPSAFVDSSSVSDIEIDGTPCPLSASPEAGSCSFRENKLAYAAALGSKPPTAIQFRVPEGVAAREEEIRGKRVRISALSAATFDVEGFDGPVISTQSVAARVAFSSITANSVLRFRPVVLPSPIFLGTGPFTFEVEVTSRDVEPWILWQGAVRDSTHPLVEIPLDPEKFPRRTRIAFRTTRTAHNIFGPQPVWVDVVVSPPAP